MPQDTRRDRLIAAAACLVLAAMLGAVAAWLGLGLLAAGEDHARFETPGDLGPNRAQMSVSNFACYVVPVAGVCALAALALVVLAVFMVARRRT